MRGLFTKRVVIAVRRCRCQASSPARFFYSAAPLRNFSISILPSLSFSPSSTRLTRESQYCIMASSSSSSGNPFSTLLGNNNPQTARLAILQPAETQDAPIELILTDVVLKDTSYECISYDRSSKTLTAAADPVTVTVDGVAQEIPKQLGDALRTFRRKARPRTLWADVLVGRTPAERSAQARVQCAVLEGAERTLCWIGPDDEDTTSKAFETITEMGRRYEEASRAVGIGPDDRAASMPLEKLEQIRERLNACAFDDLNSFKFDVWRKIRDIFGALYWSSVQAVAEIILAKAPIVVCGRSNIRWLQYIAASRALPFYETKFFKTPVYPHTMKGIDISNQIEVAKRRRRLGQEVELLPMIQTARDCEPRDPRESVFSMTLIATPSKRVESHKMGVQPLPTIDYDKTPQQVFIEAARYTILERQDLMLWFHERPPCARRMKGLPSWVPDWASVPPWMGSSFNPTMGMRRWWDTIKPETAKKPLTISDDNALHLQARPLDRIVHVSPTLNGGNARRLCYTEFQKLHEVMSSASTSSSPNPFANEPSATTVQRFWRTLVLNSGGARSAANTASDSIPPPDNLGASFESVLAEEAVMAALDCSMHELQTPENLARMRESPEIMSLLPRCGKAGAYEQLLIKNAAGRRFFRTEGGRFGMTAIEDVRSADPNLDREKESEVKDGGGGDEGEVERRRMGDLGRMMKDPISKMMMDQFQVFLNKRDPNMARIHAKAVRGALTEMTEDSLGRLDDGVREGDLVVACVGGFFPYILRPKKPEKEEEIKAKGADAETETEVEGEASKHDGDKHGKSKEQPTEQTSEAPEDSSTYEFVGDCYLHGAMQGEDFQKTQLFVGKYFDVDVSKLVDIKIV
ncbi:hypothetical protein F4806DRAFT_470054 [Annulohypoxylon nitens]|nr:hypothetical protein F4806DRAFT_470054 [Annulohypoxylon nitens]